MKMPVASTTPETDQTTRSTLALLNQFFSRNNQGNFAIRLWSGEILSARTNLADFTLVLNHPGALRRMLRPPLELSLGKAFIYGDIDIEGNIHAAVAWIDGLSQVPFSKKNFWSLFHQLKALPDSEEKRHRGRGPARLTGSRHSRTRDREAITYHYDVGNNFYAQWLDKWLTYSCAYFVTGAENLDAAQEQKYEHICRKLRLKTGERLLDIGCGWGGLLMYAAREVGATALGVTLSEKQAAFAAERISNAGLQDHAEVKLQDYRDLADESFDKIVSVGMFEHVGRGHLPEYFTYAYRLLKPGGLFLNHGISRQPKKPVRIWQALIEQCVLGSNQFIQRYVFPDGELVPVSELNLVAEDTGFEIRDVENLREHYVLTLRHWVNRLEDHWIEAIETSDEVTCRTWRLYMAASAYGFETGRINVNQSLLAKPISGQVTLPWTRADLYT